ncbi:unnamed protein product [Callosobruchus maculatus]|uniref:Uncharacterized protein n=1 Tax=Callosobruchus maculatus TaxID=64391 RepID=A0A653CDY6_CALMS|nr:unnamed protein product [Callosobruchus maculatus]
MLYAKNVFVVLFLLSVVLAGIDAASLRDKCNSDDFCKQFQHYCDHGAKQFKAVVKMRCISGQCKCKKI